LTGEISPIFFNAEKTVVDGAVYSLSLSPSTPDIFVVSQNLSQIALNFGRFLPSQILRGGVPQNCTRVITST